MMYQYMCIISLCLVRCCRFGFRYFPVIDDWIQYISYQNVPDLYNHWFIGADLYYARPLAGLMDLYVWGKIGMSWSFFIITLLHGISCCMFLYALRNKGIRAGIGFTVIYMLLPINTEATMWLSASTRIVFSLFLISLSLITVEKSKVLFWLFNLLSLFFYEQTAVLSIAMGLYFAHSKKLKIIPVINGLIFILYYIIFSGRGTFGARSSIAIPDISHIVQFASDVAEAFFIKQWQLISNGMARGFEILSINGFLFILIAAVAVCVSLMVKDEGGKGGIFLGAVLTVLPLLPYLFVSQGLSFRAFMPSLVGLGIMADGIFKQRYIKAAAALAIIPLLLTVGISELSDYRSVSNADRVMAQRIIINNAPSFRRKESVTELNVLYMQHITNVSESDWAMTGCVRALTGNPDYLMLICEE